MFCLKCSKEVPDGVNFCPACGEHLSSAVPQTAAVQGSPQFPASVSIHNSSKKKRAAWITGALAIVLAAVAVAGAVYSARLNDPVRKFQSAGNSWDIEQMKNLYYEMSFEQQQGAQIIAQEAAENLLQQVVEKEIPYEEGIEILSEMQPFFGEDTLRKYLELMNAKIYISVAQDAENEGEIQTAIQGYQSAISLYQMVSPEDQDCQAAEKRLQVLREEYKQSLLDDSKKSMEAGDYGSALATLSMGPLILGEDSEIEAKTEEYRQSLKHAALESAAELATREDYAGAVNELEQALEILMNDSEITAKQGEYQAKLSAEPEGNS